MQTSNVYHARKKTQVFLWVALTALFLFSAETSAQIMLEADFEEGNFNEIRDRHTASPGSVSTVSNPLINSSNPSGTVARFRTTGNSERAEIRIRAISSEAEYWYGWQVYIPNNWQAARRGSQGGGGDIITQWHRSPNIPDWARGHPMTINIGDDGSYGISWNYGGPNRVERGARFEGINANDDKGKWVSWAFHVKWARQGTGGGFMRLYHDGDLVFSNDGPNLENLSRNTMMWKAGIYHGNPSNLAQDPYDIYMDNFIQGNSNASLSDVNPYLDASPPDNVPVTGVSLNNCPTMGVAVGSTVALKAEMQPGDATNQAVSWTSSDEAVAMISDAGVVTALTEGTVTLTVQSEDGNFTDRCTITVGEDTSPANGVVTVGGDTYQVEALGSDDFDDGTWQDQWFLEDTLGQVSIEDGQLRTQVPPGISSTGINMWYTGYNEGELPQNILVKCKATSIQSGEGIIQLILLNANVRQADNTPYVLGTYSGADRDYQNNLRAYRMGFTGSTLSLRATPPRTVLLYQDTTNIVEEGQTYELVYVIKDGRIKLYVDEVLVFDEPHAHPEYPEPFDGGKFGLRTNRSTILWDDFAFYALSAEDSIPEGDTTTVVTLQAEEATVGGGASASDRHAGANGSGFVNFNRSGSSVVFTDIDGGSGGSAALTLRYALGARDRTGLLVVNGQTQELVMESTGSWDNWTEQQVSINLTAGSSNTIRLESNGQDFGNLDEISVAVGSSSLTARSGTERLKARDKVGQPSLRVYPNPGVGGHFHLVSPEAAAIQLTVTDFSGRVIEGVFDPAAGVIDLSAQPDGVYLLRTTQGESFKLIKE